MARIAILVDNAPNTLIAALHRITGDGIGKIRQCLQEGKPVIERDLFDSHYDETAAILRKTMAAVSDDGGQIRMFLLSSSAGPYRSGASSGQREITPDILNNMLNEADKELERQMDGEDDAEDE